MPNFTRQATHTVVAVHSSGNSSSAPSPCGIATDHGKDTWMMSDDESPGPRFVPGSGCQLLYPRTPARSPGRAHDHDWLIEWGHAGITFEVADLITARGITFFGWAMQCYRHIPHVASFNNKISGDKNKHKKLLLFILNF
jgi:hypothetical protein